MACEIPELKKFCKSNFDQKTVSSTAENLKYTTILKSAVTQEIENPSDDFVRLLLVDVYEGKKNQKVIDRFLPLVKKSISAVINDIVNQKISSALTEGEGTEKKKPQVIVEVEPIEPPLKVLTTQEELESYYLICGILYGVVPKKHIAYRDTESYFGILYKDNNRKPICRLILRDRKSQIIIPDKDNNFIRYPIDSINDIPQYKDLIVGR